MIGVLLITFWTFLLALLHTITTLYYLMMRYYDDRVIRRKARYHEENPRLPLDDKDAFIEVTWLYDLLRMVVVPLMAIYSFPLSALLTSRAYQLSLTGADLMKRALVQGDSMKSFTLSNILLVIGLFFVFRYLIYLAKGLFRVFKLRNMIEEKTDTLPLKESDVNLSLANTIFSLLGWALYLLVAFSILDLPKNALTYITTGLAAGVGFALKDLINNFFYGIQLMAGRIRIGDKISCDGVRGVVKRVSYQITQVEDEDGSLIAFTNTDLFTKKFRNLNSGRNYELVKIFVSIRYGTDFEKARQVILEALQPPETSWTRPSRSTSVSTTSAKAASTSPSSSTPPSKPTTPSPPVPRKPSTTPSTRTASRFPSPSATSISSLCRRRNKDRVERVRILLAVGIRPQERVPAVP